MSDLWIFGYGSLIWRPGFAAAEARRARVCGYARRFWQASHDHRGTPEQPGRVVTLVPCENTATAGIASADCAGADCECVGRAWRVEPAGQSAVLRALDHREKDGYRQIRLNMRFDDGQQQSAITWLADETNPSWAGDTGLAHIASVIARAHGPSGANVEYLHRLASSLNELEAHDTHVEAVLEQVGRLVA